MTPDCEFLSMLINGCTWLEIQEMFKKDINSIKKQIKYNDKWYQCSFVGLHCIGVYEI